MGRITKYGKAGHEIHGRKAGTVMTAEFWLEDQHFVALNGGPDFKFSEAVSFIVNCESQQEIDYYWNKLGEGGDKAAQQCGWLKDKFGLSWQIVPTALAEMMNDEDTRKTDRVMTTMLKMKKLDLAKLNEAFAGQLLQESV